MTETDTRRNEPLILERDTGPHRISLKSGVSPYLAAAAIMAAIMEKARSAEVKFRGNERHRDSFLTDGQFLGSHLHMINWQFRFLSQGTIFQARWPASEKTLHGCQTAGVVLKKTGHLILTSARARSEKEILKEKGRYSCGQMKLKDALDLVARANCHLKARG
jgi:hypothetical protein